VVVARAKPPVSGQDEFSAPTRETQQRCHRVDHAGIDVGLGEFARCHRGSDVLGPLLTERHLDVEPCGDGLDRVAQPGDEVGDDEAVPAPLGASDRSIPRLSPSTTGIAQCNRAYRSLSAHLGTA
jgi:hypothetical protein